MVGGGKMGGVAKALDGFCLRNGGGFSIEKREAPLIFRKRGDGKNNGQKGCRISQANQRFVTSIEKKRLDFAKGS